MTDSNHNKTNQPPLDKPLPTWIVSGVLGLVFGGGLTFLGLQFLGYPSEATSAGAATASSGPSPGMGGGGMGGGGGMMGGGGGMMGGGNAPRGKRNLTTLVAKLDLASKGIPFQLDEKQSSTLAEQLALLEELDNMTQDDAQQRCDTLEETLTEDQKQTLASFEIPRPPRSSGAGGGPGGGGPGGGGPGGGGGPPPGAAGGMPPGGPSGSPAGAADDSNPFQEEAHQSRLHSLLERLKGG